MRRGFVFNAARAAAVASLGPAAYGLPEPAVERGPSVYEARVLEFLDGLWQDAWNADFVLRESGMELTPGPQPGSSTVTVFRRHDAIAAGTYDEVVRLVLPEIVGGAGVPGDGLVATELFVTAGILHGLDGFTTPALGLVRRVTVAGDGETPPLVVEGFTPLGTTPDLVFAVHNAGVLYTTLVSLATLSGGEPYENDPCRCRQTYDNEVAACAASTVSCELKCTALALGGVAACLGAGPFMPACMVLVIAAEVACLGACVAEYEACKLRAESAHLRCRQLCVEGTP